MINPSKTLVMTEKKNFSEVEFPLIFKICIRPGFNETEVKNLGYRTSWEYLLGRSRYNGSIYGWAGHTPDGGVISNASGNTTKTAQKDRSSPNGQCIKRTVGTFKTL